MEDLAKLTLRELLTLARERLGPGASPLKTRAELLAALTGEVTAGAPPGSPAPPPPAPLRSSAPAPAVQVVTRDFFRRRT